MSGPHVSVIMPFLDAQAHLAQAVESVIGQTLTDWELLLVDDGATDDSPRIASNFAAREPRIRLLPPDPARRGAAAARNRGIAAVQGEYVAFLDSDDLYEPGKLAHDAAALDADGEAAWVYGATRWFYEGERRRDYVERLGLRLNRRYLPPELLNRIILEERGDIPCTCGVMIRRSALEVVGGFEEQFALYEDQSLWVKLLLRYPVRVLSGCNARYRQHPASTSSAAVSSGDYSQSAGHPARDAFLNWVAHHAAEHDAPPSVFRSLGWAKGANDGRLLPRILRRVRIMNRFFY